MLNARLLLAEIPIGGPGYAEFSIYGRNLTDFKTVSYTHLTLPTSDLV